MIRNTTSICAHSPLRRARISQGASVEDKALFFAATMLINQLYFEGQSDGVALGAAPAVEKMER